MPTDRPTIRAPGYYWIVRKADWRCHVPQIAAYDGNWWLIGDECEKEDAEITCLSNRLEAPPTADADRLRHLVRALLENAQTTVGRDGYVLVRKGDFEALADIVQ